MSEPGRLVYRAYQSFWSGFDWLFPPRCGGCGKEGKRWCDLCAESVQLITSPVCPICGGKQSVEKMCEGCISTPPSYVALRSWAAYAGPLRQAILRLKFQRDIAMGEILSRPLVTCLGKLNWPVDLVVPVPASLARLKKRGYNQVSLLARPVGLGLNIPYRSQALRKVRETRSQVGLTAEERRLNVKDVFQAEQRTVKGRTVLVVDDITTTGSTIEECAKALCRAGARQVYGLTLARSTYASTASAGNL
jgi:competence protein ComFC